MDFAAAPLPVSYVMTEPIMTEKQSLVQYVKAWLDPMAASRLSDHAPGDSPLPL
jgi:hypothetical protein